RMTVPDQPNAARRITPFAVALLIVWAMALTVRVYAITWDEGQDLHPDELFVAKIVIVDRIRLDLPIDWANLLDPEHSTLNPRSNDPNSETPREFAYGALPLLVTDFVAWILTGITDVQWNYGERVYLVGRAMSALVDSLTVLVVYLMGRMVAGKRVGLIAALFAALAPMMIQLSHFFTTDVWVAFFVALCLWHTMRAAKSPTIGNFVVAGFAAGLAMASKGSVFTLFGVIVAAAIGSLYLSSWRNEVGRSLRWLGWRVLGAGAAAIIGFGLFEPYALARPGTYLTSLQIQARIVRGVFDVPFTRHFVDDGQLEAFAHLARGVGPVFFWLAVVGLVIMAISGWRSRSIPIGVLLLWLVGYSAVVMASEVRFLRYFAPIVPVLAVAAGFAVMRITDAAARWIPRRGSALITASCAVGVALWTAAFLSVYAQEHPRLAASRWMYANLPPGSVTTGEIWDDGLPRAFNSVLNQNDFQFAFQAVDIYTDSPPPETAERLRRVVRLVDSIVLSSNRVVTSINAAPWRYPVQRVFYEALDDGSLGFGPAVVFQVQPTILGLSFDDSTADESFINYDHPTVRIYPLADRPTKEAFDSRMADAIAQPWSPTRYPPPPGQLFANAQATSESLMLSGPVGDLPVVGDARWSAALTSNSWAALAVWVAFLVVLQLIGEPIAARLFSGFRDRGIGFARWLTVLIAAWIVWFGSSFSVLQFRAWVCWLALGVVAVCSVVLWRRSGRVFSF
ncbi:MAG: glycosyltransferase family 39 protein, partial [Chloroflexota bacterium]